MKEFKQVGEIQSLGNQELILAKSNLKQGYFYKIKKRAQSQQSQTHYVLIIDGSKSSKQHFHDIKKALKWGLKFITTHPKHRLSLIVFEGKKEMKWLLKEVQAEELRQQSADIEDAIHHVLSHYRYASLINVLESVMRQLDFSIATQFIVFSSQTFQLMEYEMDLKSSRFLKVATLLNQHSVRLDILSFNEWIPLNFKKWLEELNQMGQIHYCLKKSDSMFYLKRIMKNQRLTILLESREIFLCRKGERIYTTEPLALEVMDDEVIVAFKQPLQISDSILGREASSLQDVVKEFYNQFVIYLLRSKSISQASELLAIHQGEILSKSIKEGCTDSEVLESMRCLANYQSLKKESSLSVLNLLECVMTDEASSLLWNRHQPYENVTPKIQAEEEDLAFLPSSVDFFEVVDWIFSNTKLNVSLKVKVEGFVEELTTGLKVEAYQFKTYTILLDGILRVEEIYCVLSPALKKRCKELKLIKKVLYTFNQEICVINLKKLPITHHLIYERYTPLEVSQMIYEVERLKCWQGLLKEMLLRRKRQLFTTQRLQEDARCLIKRRYHITDSGLYVPRGKKESPRLETEYYLARVVEWKAMEFKKEAEKRLAYEYLMNRASTEETSLEVILMDELKRVSERRKNLQEQVNLIRLSVSLQKVDFFKWDEQKVLPKTQMDSVFKINTILRGNMMVSTKQLLSLKVCENAYTVLVRCPVSSSGQEC